MKKNKAMRTGTALLVATLLTTSILSGTFAKYVTGDGATDTARVAKFGVTVTAVGDLFGATYKNKADGNSITSYGKNDGTVSSSDGAKVVAPGTQGGTQTFTITGTPEVATQIIVGDAENASGVDYENSDICLKTGSYGVMVKYAGTITNENVTNYYTKSGDTYTKIATAPATLPTEVYQLNDAAEASSDYYPISWTVNTGSDATYTKAADVAAALGTQFGASTQAPNTDLSKSATVTWKWEFGDDYSDATEITKNDPKDTILGDMIAATDGLVVKSGDDYVAVKYATVNAGTTAADAANADIVVAYTGTTAPAYNGGDSIVACLTESLSTRITVTQVD